MHEKVEGLRILFTGFTSMKNSVFGLWLQRSGKTFGDRVAASYVAPPGPSLPPSPPPSSSSRVLMWWPDCWAQVLPAADFFLLAVTPGTGGHHDDCVWGGKLAGLAITITIPQPVLLSQHKDGWLGWVSFAGVVLCPTTCPFRRPLSKPTELS